MLRVGRHAKDFRCRRATGATCYAMGHAYFQRKPTMSSSWTNQGKSRFRTSFHRSAWPRRSCSSATIISCRRSSSQARVAGVEQVSVRLAVRDARRRRGLSLHAISHGGTSDSIAQRADVRWKIKVRYRSRGEPTLELRPPSGAFADAPDWLRRVMDPNAHCVFLDTSTIGPDARETPPPTINETEMDVVLAVVGRLCAAPPPNTCARSPRSTPKWTPYRID